MHELNTPSPLKTLSLKKNEDRRIRNGHCWIFSNEINTKKTPLNSFQAGELSLVQDHKGHLLGQAYVNPNSLICARLVTRGKQRFDENLIKQRILSALQSRERLFTQPYYRLVYSESDFLPGLVIDRFANTLIVQITTAGMEQYLDSILQNLQDLLKPDLIILQNTMSVRQLEGLELYSKTVLGEAPSRIEIIENDCRFEFDALHGQKTGWFYDHRMNRKQLQQYAKDLTVLDVFSYIGAWGIQCAQAGAKQITCIEASTNACELIQSNSGLNGLSNIEIMQGDAFESLQTLISQKQHYDIVIVDPPAFIKRKKDIKAGMQAYHRINELAMRLTTPGGQLVSASCSYHFNATQHQKTLLNISRQEGKFLQILQPGVHSPDHPIHPAIPETAYLSTFITRVS